MTVQHSKAMFSKGIHYCLVGSIAFMSYSESQIGMKFKPHTAQICIVEEVIAQQHQTHA